MPIKLLTPGKGGVNSTTLRSYLYRSKDEQATRLLEFVKDVEVGAYVYYTEDPEFGRKLLNENKSLVSMLRLGTTASPYLKQLLAAASAILDIGEQEKLLWSATYPTPTSTNSRAENSLLIVPVGQPVQTLRGFAGKCNKKPTDDLYGTLSEGISAEVIEELENKVRNYWEGDQITFRYEQYAWEGAVDEALFAKSIEEKAGKDALKGVAAASFIDTPGREAMATMARLTGPATTSKYLTAIFGKTVTVSRVDNAVLVDGVEL